MSRCDFCGTCKEKSEVPCFGVKYCGKDPEVDLELTFCSVSCLVEWVWNIKADPPKLSTSRLDISGILMSDD